MKVAVIIPAYNAADHLDQLLTETLKQADTRDIVVIDDGSRDATRSIAESCGVRCLSHSQNRGKGMALKTGFAHALSQRYDSVMTMDADGQHDPKYIPELIDIYRAGHYDIVIGSRRNNFDRMSFARYLSNSVTTVVVSLLARQAIEDSQCGYRLIRREVLEAVKLETDGYQMESELLIKAGRMGFRIGHVSIDVKASGTSHIRHLTDTLKFLGMTFKTLWI
jgi:glycosyltransferase involved in cell wall biosynthesis